MNIWTDLRQLIFPDSCVICRSRLTGNESGICTRCDATLPYTRLMNSAGNLMEQCFWGRFPIQRASAMCYYAKNGNVAQILYAMKYHGQKELCRIMGRRMATHFTSCRFFEGIDCLVPVPLHSSRLRQRGYNQSEELARGISWVTGIPVWTDVMTRTKNNDTQTHKSSFARWENTESLFATTKHAGKLRGKHILLIDDVLTTGATLTACADALSAIKEIRISVLTLAWAK